MDPVVAEILKLGIGFFLQSARAANMTEEQIMKLFNEEKAKFDANDPSKLKDV